MTTHAARPPRPHAAGRCDVCGKVAYPTKAAAKVARRRLHPGEAMSVYRCGCWWHLGHLPANVRTGDTDRHDLPNRRGVSA